LALYERAEPEPSTPHRDFPRHQEGLRQCGKGGREGYVLRRLGVDADTVEFFMHVDRGITNWVRTGWEAMREREGRAQPRFESHRGVAQGAAESPLLWVIFFDMILSQLLKKAVNRCDGAC
jgi:hypothetical protein